MVVGSQTYTDDHACAQQGVPLVVLADRLQTLHLVTQTLKPTLFNVNHPSFWLLAALHLVVECHCLMDRAVIWWAQMAIVPLQLAPRGGNC